jgi:hypothetical protein
MKVQMKYKLFALLISLLVSTHVVAGVEEDLIGVWQYYGAGMAKDSLITVEYTAWGERRILSVNGFEFDQGSSEVVEKYNVETSFFGPDYLWVIEYDRNGVEKSRKRVEIIFEDYDRVTLNDPKNKKYTFRLKRIR